MLRLIPVDSGQAEIWKPRAIPGFAAVRLAHPPDDMLEEFGPVGVFRQGAIPVKVMRGGIEPLPGRVREQVAELAQEVVGLDEDADCLVSPISSYSSSSNSSLISSLIFSVMSWFPLAAGNCLLYTI